VGLPYGMLGVCAPVPEPQQQGYQTLTDKTLTGCNTQLALSTDAGLTMNCKHPCTFSKQKSSRNNFVSSTTLKSGTSDKKRNAFMSKYAIEKKSS